MIAESLLRFKKLVFPAFIDIRGKVVIIITSLVYYLSLKEIEYPQLTINISDLRDYEQRLSRVNLLKIGNFLLWTSKVVFHKLGASYI